MKTNFVVEGVFDQLVLVHALRAANRTPGRIVVAGGHHRLAPLAISMLARWPEPLILLADADTTDVDTIEAHQHELEAELSWVSGAPDFRVVLAAPEIEAVFFEDGADDQCWIERFLPTPLTTQDRIEARFTPKRVLSKLAQQSGLSIAELVSRFDMRAWEEVARHPCIMKIRDSMDEMSPTERQAALG